MLSELQKRTLSALVLVILVLALTLWSFESFAALCFVGAAILWQEWRGLTRMRSRWFIPLGIIYIGFAMAALLTLRYHGSQPIISLFILVWAADISAYIVGRRWGKHKIIPRISPGKSWEGLMASIVICGAMGTAYAFSLTTPNTDSVLPYRQIIMTSVLAASFAVVGLAGDLFESSLKRHAGVKDSGQLIPGHGGLFDRVDALLACAIYSLFILAVFYVVLTFFVSVR